MKWIVMALFVTLETLAGVSVAAEMPTSSQYDKRIQYVDYNPADVVVVRTVTGIGSRVVFAKDETIIDVAAGFSQGWELTHRSNTLYIKAISIKGDSNQPHVAPQPGVWDTNIMVTTNRRMYDMDLYLLPNSTKSSLPINRRISYRIEYQYPQEEAARKRALEQAQRAQIKMDAKPVARNWNYSMEVGDFSENIAPTMAYDDGRFTYLKFPNNRDFPAAFLIAAEKSESLVNSHIDPAEPDVLVIHRIAQKMVLRLGKAVVSVFNDSFDPDGLPPVAGTTVPGVQRVTVSVGSP